MENENDNDHMPETSGRSVFGDDAPVSEELPVVDLDSESSVFSGSAGDAPGVNDATVSAPAVPDAAEATSVFGDPQDEGQLSLDDDSAASVFGDPSASLEDDPWAVPPDTSSSVIGSSTPSDAGFDNDDVDLPDPSAPGKVTIDSWSTPDEAPMPETVALDVEPADDDALDAWSDLGGPQWSEESEAGSQPEAWDPEFVDNKEPAVVALGGDAGNQFFAYDDPGQGDQFDAGFVDDSPGNDMQARVITGVGLLVVGIIGLALGPTIALALIVLVVALCAGEFFNALRVAGYQPATLLGLAASVAMPIAVFVRGPQAVALVLALTVVFGMLWFLLGVGSEIPTMNIGVTLLGVVYIGVLGSFGAAMLEIAGRAGLNGDDGTGLLLAAIVITVGYDVGAYFAGRSIGRTPLTAVSPNKTVEGLIGGAVTSAVAAIVVFGLVEFGEPWGTADAGFFSVVALGVVGAIVAPLGDLGESLIKRDLGIKDMGSVLPGHGGFLDRFDALLFVLPAVYFFAEVVFYTS